MGVPEGPDYHLEILVMWFNRRWSSVPSGVAWAVPFWETDPSYVSPCLLCVAFPVMNPIAALGMFNYAQGGKQEVLPESSLGGQCWPGCTCTQSQFRPDQTISQGFRTCFPRNREF